MLVRALRICAVLSAAGLAACSADMSTESDRASADELMQADRLFAEASAQRGLDGWMSFYADDAARVALHGDVVRGLADIRSSDSALFADPAVRLVWEPTDAGLFRGGDTGFTRGRYSVVRVKGARPDTLSRGAYLTIWRRDGEEWKVILDTGATDPERDE